jgi:hypothetical protein
MHHCPVTAFRAGSPWIGAVVEFSAGVAGGTVRT